MPRRLECGVGTMAVLPKVTRIRHELGARELAEIVREQPTQRNVQPGALHDTIDVTARDDDGPLVDRDDAQILRGENDVLEPTHAGVIR